MNPLERGDQMPEHRVTSRRPGRHQAGPALEHVLVCGHGQTSARHPVDHRQHRPALAARDHRPARHGAGRASTPTAPTRSARTPPSCAGWPEPTGDRGHQRHRGAARARRRRLLLQPAVAEHRRAVRTARVGRQRLHLGGLDHRWQAEPRGPRADPEGVRERQRLDLRQRRPPGHDQHGRHGAQRLVRAGGRDPDHRVGRLLDVRERGDADGDGVLARPRDARPRRSRCAGRARSSPSQPR